MPSTRYNLLQPMQPVLDVLSYALVCLLLLAALSDSCEIGLQDVGMTSMHVLPFPGELWSSSKPPQRAMRSRMVTKPRPENCPS